MAAGSFQRQPEPVSGVYPVQDARQGRLERIADFIRRDLGVEVAAVLDVRDAEARVALRGALLDCTPEKEAVLMLWMQEVETARVRRTPPKLLLVFGCLEVLVVPIETPAQRLGVLAVSLTRRAMRAIGELSSLAAELALMMEHEARKPPRAQRESVEIPTLPAPPGDLFDEVA